MTLRYSSHPFELVEGGQSPLSFPAVVYYISFPPLPRHLQYGSRIPQYHAKEATKAIIPLLGELCHQDKQRNFLPALWESFTKCQWIDADNVAKSKERAFWYKGGSSPPPESSMGKRGWLWALNIMVKDWVLSEDWAFS
ncbi:uncharacterized protein K452DRAFT_311544 [Aplosporella prunicola CBS 121167]|uniref:Uncharacterized protein n=1 Tax=Aplosporella prunicola CBS 121167 TaxID=1176127 RepID=A0A6A6B330_9PEZI|nr:uncharacterized protein K452DRAFT_311544 [Aplosporella prunicola CBS 121167]KAF2138622.1 hypothetical protein K452DRAFT_311544 [Aplosporella prunicola CBS 121167]